MGCGASSTRISSGCAGAEGAHTNIDDAVNNIDDGEPKTEEDGFDTFVMAQSAESRPFYSFSSFVLQNTDPVIFGWRFHREIGKGALSRVFLATHIETGDSYAAKVYSKPAIMRHTIGREEPPYIAVEREIVLMTEIKHRYVVPLIEVIDDDQSGSLIILMPHAGHGTLSAYLNNPVEESTLALCFFEVAEALCYIHSVDVVHRDIKPDNVLVFTDKLFLLSDFSVSTKLLTSDQLLADTKGSPAFLSPEECSGDEFYPKPADVWAFGVTLYRSVFGKLPFKLDEGQGPTVANTIYAVAQLIETEKLEFPDDIAVSPELDEVLRATLQYKAADRPTFADIVKFKWFESAKEVDLVNIQRYKEDDEAAAAAAVGTGGGTWAEGDTSDGEFHV